MPLSGTAASSYGPFAFPNAAYAAGSSVRLLVPLAIVAAVFALGWWVFTREAPCVAENL